MEGGGGREQGKRGPGEAGLNRSDTSKGRQPRVCPRFCVCVRMCACLCRGGCTASRQHERVPVGEEGPES